MQPYDAAVATCLFLLAWTQGLDFHYMGSYMKMLHGAITLVQTEPAGKHIVCTLLSSSVLLTRFLWARCFPCILWHVPIACRIGICLQGRCSQQARCMQGSLYTVQSWLPVLSKAHIIFHLVPEQTVTVLLDRQVMFKPWIHSQHSQAILAWRVAAQTTSCHRLRTERRRCLVSLCQRRFTDDLLY